jgi:hypothetical protein
MDAADTEWKAAMAAVGDMMTGLQKMLQDCGINRTGLEELQKLLMKGHLSSGTLTYLTSTFGEATPH